MNGGNSLDQLINSEEYWKKRFMTDWNKYSGEEQTAFFAKITCCLFPDWLTKSIRMNKYVICDMGCACGEAVNILSQFLNTEVCGIDFADSAIEIARKKFPSYNFEQADILNLDPEKKFDVVYCSNVLEHFHTPWIIAEKMASAAQHYLILQMPFREHLTIDEHFFKFDTNTLPMQIGEFVLVNLETINGSELQETLYPDQQILLVYSSHREDLLTSRVEDIYKGIKTSDLIAWNNKKQEIETCHNAQIAELKVKLENLKTDYSLVSDEFNKRGQLIEVSSEQLRTQINTNGLLQEEIQKQKELMASLTAKHEEVTKKLFDTNNLLQEKIDAQKELVTSLLQKSEATSKELAECNNNYNALKEEFEALSDIKEKYASLFLEKKQLDKDLHNKESIIFQAKQRCVYMASTKTFRIVHLLFRLKYQFLKGTKADRKNFRKWLKSELRRKGGDSERSFNPIWSIINILDEINGTKINPPQKLTGDIVFNNTPLAKHLLNEQKRLSSNSNMNSKEYMAIKEVLNSNMNKQIMIYPHVVYWEPLQTPQQLLKAFANSGWLCFFCEHPNLQDIYREVYPNLYIVHEKELLRAIENREVFVLLTWLGSVSFINQISNKQIWYHILDKLDLFPYYDEYYMKLHKAMVDESPYVSYVATPLLSCLENRKDAIYLPNAVNPEEFLNIHNNYVPEDMKPILAKNHKIIGYYGYLAEWMDYELVRKLAVARPDYEFVFIGKAIYDTSLIDNLPNVHLLGLKSYKELSDYAKFFNVATIPFTINEKMDCVSPIKFYEYCALGLPIVTSHMKEMENFVCDFVACANGVDEFLYYLNKMTTGECCNMAAQNGPVIAMQNTWNSRVKIMEDVFNKELQTILNASYEKFDVIFLGVIDFDYRYQRPQHFASRFAKNGHRVFYVNANHFNPDSTTRVNDDLYVINMYNDQYTAIHLTDWYNQKLKLYKKLDELMNTYCIRDAIVIVDYPNWIIAAEYLRNMYGFKIISDYMDDFTGFLNPAETLVKENCKKLLESSDFVVASSEFLYNIAKEYNKNIEIIRNGTEYEHFNQAAIEHYNDRKIIGYYGAVAEWFDSSKIAYVAQNMPDCDIIIIGRVTAGEKQLLHYKNIKLLGELPYDELPKYLEKFDVCLIPFDTSTSLIKATNPVKFYEYLSAGKKIVATEIPELESFKNKYVYLSNDNQQFLNYIQICLDNKDCLVTTNEKLAFALENDWQVRYKKFTDVCRKTVPKISIIVLTYNNLKINKICISSILHNTAYPNFELIVVDNLSTDGTRDYLEKLEQEDSRVKVILNNENKGFAGGNNIGIKASNGDYVLLLNNDTIVTRGWLTAMTKHLENNSKLGMCGPVTNSIGNEAKIKVNYHTIKEMYSFAYRYTTEHLNEEYENPNVLALFCTMIKREVIDSCGTLDEMYGVGMFEDDDYAEAVKQKGYELAIAEDAFIHHFEGASFKKLEDKRFHDIYDKNKELFEKKWNKKWIMHKKREGINWDTNSDVNIL